MEEAAKFMKVKAVWQFFEAERDGNDIHLSSRLAARAASTPSNSDASLGQRNGVVDVIEVSMRNQDRVHALDLVLGWIRGVGLGPEIQ
jgi:hypothetical protein